MLARVRGCVYDGVMEREQRAELAKQQWEQLDTKKRSQRTRNAAIRNRAAAIERKTSSAVELLGSLGFQLVAPEDLEARIYQSAREQQS